MWNMLSRNKETNIESFWEKEAEKNTWTQNTEELKGGRRHNEKLKRKTSSVPVVWYEQTKEHEVDGAWNMHEEIRNAHTFWTVNVIRVCERCGVVWSWFIGVKTTQSCVLIWIA
jgi:hypothetical protein